MARQRKEASGFQGTKQQWDTKNLKKQQTLSWKPVNEKTYAFLCSVLEEAELKLFSEKSDLTGEDETEAVQTLTRLKKRCMKKLKSAYYPEAKWQNIDLQSCVEWLEKMKAKNTLLQKAQEEEERELEKLEDEMQDT